MSPFVRRGDIIKDADIMKTSQLKNVYELVI
jgi:hypothetical protein